MCATKEKIMLVSLELFAKDGYEAVSVRMIAEKLGVTKGALYKHYKNKQDIFDSIVEHMVKNDVAYAEKFAVPTGLFHEMEEEYRKTTFESINEFAVAIFRYWTEDELASNFRKMLIIEQYRNPEMKSLMHQIFTGGPLEYMEDLFRESVEYSDIVDKDYKILALQYYSPVYMLMNLYDVMEDKSQAVKMLKKHIESIKLT
jgi:AcrR family transcriptional regulator